MRSSAALKDGIRRVNSAPVVLGCVFAVTLLTALPFAMIIRQELRSHLGNSLAADQAARGVNYQWWTEFTAQAGALGKTFDTTIIGFAAVLDNLSSLLDRERRSVPVMWLGAGYLVLWLFLAGGILDRYARGRPTRSYEFFSACGVYFVRFLRLAPIVALTYYALFVHLHPFLDNLYGGMTRGVTAERTAFLLRVVFYLVFGAVLLAVNLIFDYAKVRAVVEDRRSMVGAIAAGTRFVRRHPAAVAGLWLMNGLLFLGGDPPLCPRRARGGLERGRRVAGVCRQPTVSPGPPLGEARLFRVGDLAVSGAPRARRVCREHSRSASRATDRRALPRLLAVRHAGF